MGRRLRVKQARSSRHAWLEGKIRAFDKETGRHEIQYDSGSITHLKLKNERYKWKKDQGQKPVEKLDRSTRHICFRLCRSC